MSIVNKRDGERLAESLGAGFFGNILKRRQSLLDNAYYTEKETPTPGRSPFPTAADSDFQRYNETPLSRKISNGTTVTVSTAHRRLENYRHIERLRSDAVANLQQPLPFHLRTITILCGLLGSGAVLGCVMMMVYVFATWSTDFKLKYRL
uniref:Uncharacterized protein n=1 Tax=Corethron hystrix TaxID=216773 RepID=A0A7S1BH98_9STRA|mmetsp:Transcript_27948/g.63989  ORF Transcript_27948/g.63989 Transcript_27948/m.63989 type:complete len:150 (+) Transcript_27948:76-525(+)